MLSIILLHLLITAFTPQLNDVYLPIDVIDRTSVYEIALTEIGEFGLNRKARPSIPGHLHAGIDIKRPNKNYLDEPIYSIAEGVVISKREDGPYAQLIIEHNINGQYFWTVYEHIAGIKVDLHQPVSSSNPIARFFNRGELGRHGWQFDHFHFEILKVRPVQIHSQATLPERLYKSYTLDCHTEEKLNSLFYNPLSFFAERL
ncbi:M23 family metallopeptidase [Fulvivirga lutimaris]|uniref:M23 family metallopeptidase n=1 Tax=Fulvivirga lutimaris TaxID=1819566 RepID=UPI0012BB9EBD|nr:M23 family metallopeptidase [Fulvivirga lutimaris]MTI39262.1 M23 family metallopeptidase [Fulvivirga lutimaris]